MCRAKHDSWGAAVEQVVTQLDGAPLGAVSAVEVSPAGKVYFAVAAAASAENRLESALRTELLAHTATGCVYVYDPPPARWKRCWAGWQALRVWRSARTAAPCMSPTLAAAASGRWMPLPGS